MALLSRGRTRADEVVAVVMLGLFVSRAACVVQGGMLTLFDGRMEPQARVVRLLSCWGESWS